MGGLQGSLVVFRALYRVLPSKPPLPSCRGGFFSDGICSGLRRVEGAQGSSGLPARGRSSLLRALQTCAKWDCDQQEFSVLSSLLTFWLSTLGC